MVTIESLGGVPEPLISWGLGMQRQGFSYWGEGGARGREGYNKLGLVPPDAEGAGTFANHIPIPLQMDNIFRHTNFPGSE